MSVVYLTPRKFRSMFTGHDLSAYSDAQLNEALVAASAKVNIITAAPNYPQPHDFRGGTITGERRRWQLALDLPSDRRLFVLHPPVRTITSFRIHVTEGNYVTVDPVNMFSHPGENYSEVVALTLGVGVFPVVANLSMNQPVSEVDYTYGWVLPVLGETLTTTDDMTYVAINQWWHPDPTIYVDGVDATASGQVDLNEGTVTFATAEDRTVTADYDHKLPYAFVSATASLMGETVGTARFAASPLAYAGRVKVAEVEISRTTAGGQSTLLSTWRVEANALLEPYIFHNIAGF